MINTINDIKKFINDKSFKKIYVLCGRKSFVTSGAELLFKELLNNKESKLFYKSSEIPTLVELIKIINDIKSFNREPSPSIHITSFLLDKEYPSATEVV